MLSGKDPYESRFDHLEELAILAFLLAMGFAWLAPGL